MSPDVTYPPPTRHAAEGKDGAKDDEEEWGTGETGKVEDTKEEQINDADGGGDGEGEWGGGMVMRRRRSGGEGMGRSSGRRYEDYEHECA